MYIKGRAQLVCGILLMSKPVGQLANSERQAEWVGKIAEQYTKES